MASKSQSRELKKPAMSIKERRALKRAKEIESGLSAVRRKRPERS
ncbi:hypothetical protein [Mycolicibacterium sp.]